MIRPASTAEHEAHAEESIAAIRARIGTLTSTMRRVADEIDQQVAEMLGHEGSQDGHYD